MLLAVTRDLGTLVDPDFHHPTRFDMKLYYNPISSYSQKVLTVAHEKDIKFEGVVVNLMDPEAHAAYKRDVAPIGKVPMLDLGDHKIPESSIIMEYLDTHFDTGTKMLSDDKDKARQARFFDRVADLYLMDPAVGIILNSFKPDDQKDASLVERNSAQLKESLGLFDKGLENKKYMLGNEFGYGDVSGLVACNLMTMFLKMDLPPNVKAFHERCAARDSWQHVLKELEPVVKAMMS